MVKSQISAFSFKILNLNSWSKILKEEVKNIFLDLNTAKLNLKDHVLIPKNVRVLRIYEK